MARAAVLRVVLTALLATATATASLDEHTLGPGAGPWHLSDPARVGLSRAKLDKAGDDLGEMGTPLCLAVAKDGALVLDRTYGFGQADGQADGHRMATKRPIESYSAGKTITAALMGVAYSQGLFELHTPLADQGVKPRANFSRRGARTSQM